MATRSAKADQILLDAVETAHAAAVETSGVLGVGAHLGAVTEGDRVLSHLFGCPHPGYLGWHWSVTVARASRAKAVTVGRGRAAARRGCPGGPGLDSVGRPDRAPAT